MSRKSNSSSKKPVNTPGARLRGRAKPVRPKPQGARSVPKAGGKAEDAPNVNTRPPQFATFEEAKGAAVDALIRTIEEAERLLSAVKRAHSFDELSNLTMGRVE